MEQRLIRQLLDREKNRWLLWKHDDWREMIEATPEDEDGELFFYSAEFKGASSIPSEVEAFPVEVVCWPTPEGDMEISLIITIEEGEHEAESAWMVYRDNEIEILADTTDNRELGEEEEDE